MTRAYVANMGAPSLRVPGVGTFYVWAERTHPEGALFLTASPAWTSGGAFTRRLFYGYSMREARARMRYVLARDYGSAA